WSVAIIGVLLGASLSRQIGWFAGAAAVAAFLGSILVHELSHALTARRFGVTTDSIQLWALGGVARLSREAPAAKAGGWTAVASLGAAWLLDGAVDGPLVGILAWLGVINALLAVFNLLPGAPLDGGRILRAVRWAMHGDRYRAAVEAGRVGVALGWAIAAVG